LFKAMVSVPSASVASEKMDCPANNSPKVTAKEQATDRAHAGAEAVEHDRIAELVGRQPGIGAAARHRKKPKVLAAAV
jgi:hypothetical protein